MSDRSDYKNKNRINIYDLLPDVYRSDTARVFFENTANRHLSKTDLTKVVGIVGNKNATDSIDRRISEDDPHRKAQQLQPVLRSKIATVEHVMSFVDVINELSRLGVDTTRMDKWGQSLGFNFIPPITLDKLINYRDYFWYDETNPTSSPQYITIENYLTTAKARLAQKQAELISLGQQHSITGINVTNGTFSTSSDLTFLKPGAQFKTLASTLYNNVLWTVSSVSPYQNGTTIISIVETGTLTSNSVIDGIIDFANQIQTLSDDVNCLSGLIAGPCVIEQEYNDWINDNKWVHKSDLPQGVISLAKRAELPIIEYHPGLQLNEWSYTQHRWYYRNNTSESFIEVDYEPSDSDLSDPDFLDKWVYIEDKSPIPVNRQIENTTPIILSTTDSTLSTVDNITYTFDASGLEQAITSADHLRVYVNEIRSYATYNEQDDGNGYVEAIVFLDPLQPGDQVDVYVSPAADVDKNRNEIEVRTILDDTEYNFEVLSNNQPIKKTLVRYRKVEQLKSVGEVKYPLFDMFTITGETAYQASPLFKFSEDPSYTVAPAVGKRLKVTNDGRNFFFEQTLVESKTNRIFAFKDIQSITVDNPEGLQTIWRKGLNNETYTPKWVDENNNQLPIGSENGFWEIPNQLFYNVSHENRQEVSIAELTTHFNTINANQELPSIFFKRDNFSHRLLYDLNYGVGGTIKEYNGSYDLFLSTIFENNANVISIIDFAKQYYLSLQNTIRELLTKNLNDFLLNDSNEFMNDFYGSITSEIITLYENSDINELIFGDSQTFDEATNLGIRNWIITLPFIEMLFKQTPHLLLDETLGIKELNHHDGHYSTLLINPRNINNIKKGIIKQEIFPGRLRGWTDTIPADGGVPSTRLSIDWQRLLKNDYWLEGDKLYKFNIVSLSSTAPSLSYNDGSYWLRNTDGLMFVRNSLNPLEWVPVNGTPGNVSEAWLEVNFDEIILNVYKNIEDKLFDTAPNITELKCYESDYVLDTEDEVLFQQLQEEYFFEYTRTLNILQPEGTDFILTNPFTWNYKDVTYDSGVTVFRPNIDTINNWGNRWHSINESVFNTPYPHLQPWKLQGYDNKPNWWDTQYKDISGSRRWKLSMWTDIMAGTNAIETPPNPVTYNFVSVNVNDNTESGGYKLDDLLPPFDGNLIGTPLESQLFIRNISAINFSTISDEYPFGDEGPIEWMYKKSIDYIYNQLKIFFRMQPIKFVNKLWGNKTTEIAGLEVDLDQQKVLSHVDMIFHGDLIDGETYKLNGIGQWYVNYNRVNNLDSKTSDFRELWTTWKSQLAYQANSFIDPRSFKSYTQNFNLTENDRSIIVKKTPAARNYWIDSLKVTVNKFGQHFLKNGIKVPKDKGFDWEFIIDTTVPTSRDISYYESKSYSFEVINPSLGLMQLTNGSILPWTTGDVIYLDTTDTLPFPTTPDPNVTHQAEVINLVSEQPYYLIVVSGNTFKLASSQQNANNNIFIELYDQGRGTHFIFEPNSTFFAYEQKNTNVVWYHNSLNNENLKTTKLPILIEGVQNLINFIDGYSSYLYDLGFRFNDTEQLELDPNTGLFVNWQTEIERLIDGIYTGLGIGNTSNSYTGKTFPFSSSFATDIINTSINQNTIETGQKVFLFTTGVLPAPLQQNTEYFLVKTGSQNQYKLATTLENAFLNLTIDITNDGVGNHNIGIFENNLYQSQQYIEVNPFRNNIWYSPSRGIVSNCLTGPYEDIKIDKTIFDQYGRPFNRKDLLFFREDKITRIKVVDDIINDVVSNVNSYTNQIDEYNYIHISGMNIFLDDYEHIIVFEDYSVGDYLIYDSFVGLRTPRFYVQFDRQTDSLGRPSVGGFVLNDGNDLTRNVESTVSDMQLYYDTNLVSEASPFVQYARDLIGYENPTFLDRVSASEKTKFLFWKGMIQSKGSINAVNAFINSIRFEDARVDEFWAYRIGEYGSRLLKTTPSMNVFTTDVKRGDLRFHFTNSLDSNVENTFSEITFNDDFRWTNLPDITSNLGNVENLHFESELSSSQTYEIISPLASDVFIELDKIADGVHIVSTALSNVDASNKFLTEGDGSDSINHHYTQINSKIIRLNASAINNFMVTNGFINEIVTIYTINPAYYNLNPSKLIDTKSKTKIADISIWDPARNYHSYDVVNDVDLFHYGDPVRFPNNAEHNWTYNKTHTIWLDTSKLEYKPYYDPRISTTPDKQLGNWANFSDWASADVYVWTKSSVPPEDYVNLVSVEENDITLDETERASGTPYAPLWKYDKNTLPISEFDVTQKRIRVDSSTLEDSFEEGLHIIVNSSPDNDGKYTILSIDDVGANLIDLYVNEELTSNTLGGEVLFEWRLVEPEEHIESFYEANRGAAGVSHKFDDGANVSIYVNGSFVTSGPINTADFPTYSSLVVPNIEDRVTIIREPTVAEIEELELFKNDFDFITKDEASTTGSGIQTFYYFWVKDRALSSKNHTYSALEISSRLKQLEKPHQFFRNLIKIEDGTNKSYYTQFLVRDINNLINDDNRYAVRFTKDFTLRDNSLTDILSYKNIHEEWKMFREKQPEVIPKDLWVKLVDSVVGLDTAELDNGNIVSIPSLDRVLYDQINNTTTRFGIRIGQALIEKTRGLEIIFETILLDDFNTYPIDKYTFTQNVDLTSPESIRTTMEFIYNNFPTESVNRIFFSVLREALSLKEDYPDIMKTSFLALHGIRVLQVVGGDSI